MRRRDFIARAGLTLGAASAATAAPRPVPRTAAFRPDDWASVRDQFALTPEYIHMATFLLSSHPRPVAAAIERHRRALDEDTATYFYTRHRAFEAQVREAAARYMGGMADQIALTDSTTMGLGLVYGSLHLERGQEIVTTEHDHYSTLMSLQHRAERTGASVRQVPLYADPARVTVDEVVSRMHDAIGDRTRVLAVTWVHSCTGVKLPIATMAAALREVNASRDAKDRVLFCVDGVHGFGIEDEAIDELGCDFFIAGTHKWLFGPRGTGVIWARPDAWTVARPVIPSFGPNYAVWLGFLTPDDVPAGDLMTPGGFHSFEHRWALGEAFDFHLRIGKTRVRERIHALNTMAKEGLAEMPHVTLRTPMSEAMSSGLICYEVDGLEPDAVVSRLRERGIISSRSPYRTSYARLSPSLINDEDEVERTLRAVHELG